MTALKHWSHSTIKNLVDGCQHQWFLEKIVGLPNPTTTDAARGIAYHGGIELHEQNRQLWHYTGGLLGDPEGASFEQMIDASHAQLDGLIERSDRIDPAAARSAIDAALTNWWNKRIPEGQPGAGGTLRDRVMGWRPVAVEQEFRLFNDPTVTSRPTKGFPDVVYYDDTGDTPQVVVVDHKSAKNHGKYPHDGEGLTPQKAMYLRAIRRAPGLPGLDLWPARFEFHISRVTQGAKSTFEAVRVVSLPESEWDAPTLDGRYQMAEQTYGENMAAGVWPKNPSSWLCSPKWCAFHVGAGGQCDPQVEAVPVEPGGLF